MLLACWLIWSSDKFESPLCWPVVDKSVVVVGTRAAQFEADWSGRPVVTYKAIYPHVDDRDPGCGRRIPMDRRLGFVLLVAKGNTLKVN